jgi:hypothetical protein
MKKLELEKKPTANTSFAMLLVYWMKNNLKIKLPRTIFQGKETISCEITKRERKKIWEEEPSPGNDTEETAVEGVVVAGEWKAWWPSSAGFQQADGIFNLIQSGIHLYRNR